MKINPARHEAYLRAFEGSEGFDLKDFGEVLHMGTGEPSDELKAELYDKYGMYENEG